ncbi:MAG TPA: hypothetical protein EYQ87_02020 [Candidatus Nitrosopelagicus sp.]|nr:hypothetical protein [Candidatus Nitrosopelagicus sp.]
MIGLIFPSGFSEINVHESAYPFSISHPKDWIVIDGTNDWIDLGAYISQDTTGRNGVFVGLWCSEFLGEDCGQVGNDYEELSFLEESVLEYCELMDFDLDYAKCSNLEILDSFFHELDGYRAITVVTSADILSNGKDPKFPDSKAGRYQEVGLSTHVLVGNDIWYIGSGFEADKFDQLKTEKILSTFMINDVYANEDVFYEPTWFENLINAIMSIFSWDTSSDTSSVVIETSMEEEFMPEQNYDWDNPIIIEMDPCSLYEC